MLHRLGNDLDINTFQKYRDLHDSNINKCMSINQNQHMTNSQKLKMSMIKMFFSRQK